MTYSAQRLRELITAQGVTNRYVAERIGYTETHLAHVLAGRVTMTPKLAVRVAELFRVPVTFLLEPVAELAVAA
jgi:transcriptional regulator with XRE-family HTH domain